MDEQYKENLEPQEEKEENESKTSSLMVYFPILVFVVIIVIGGYFFLKNGKKEEAATDQATDQSLFQENGFAERRSEILISDFSKGESITVDYVLMEVKGFVAIHGEVDGKPGEVLGASDLLETGETENIVIPLTREVKGGEILFAFLHVDDGDGEFSFPGPDIPVTDDYDKIIMSMFKVGESEVTIEEITGSTESAQ